MDIKLCSTCKSYKAGEDEGRDKCLHPRAAYGGVREILFYSCVAMRAGICGPEAKLHDQKEAAPVELPKKVCGACGAIHYSAFRDCQPCRDALNLGA